MVESSPLHISMMNSTVGRVPTSVGSPSPGTHLTSLTSSPSQATYGTFVVCGSGNPLLVVPAEASCGTTRNANAAMRPTREASPKRNRFLGRSPCIYYPLYSCLLAYGPELTG